MRLGKSLDDSIGGGEINFLLAVVRGVVQEILVHLITLSTFFDAEENTLLSVLPSAGKSSPTALEFILTF